MPTVFAHPAVKNVVDVHRQSLTALEDVCRRIAMWTGTPIVLLGSFVFQTVWILFGQVTKADPFPFVFLLTCSNVVQLELLFITNIAQAHAAGLAEIRAEQDHKTISMLLHHQQAQNTMLLRIAARLNVDVSDLTETLADLAVGEPS